MLGKSLLARTTLTKNGAIEHVSLAYRFKYSQNSINIHICTFKTISCKLVLMINCRVFSQVCEINSAKRVFPKASDLATMV